MGLPQTCAGQFCIFGNAWWNARIGGNHLVILLAVGIFSIYIFIHNKRVGAGLAMILSFLVITDFLINILNAAKLGSVIVYGPWANYDGVLILPTIILCAVYLRRYEVLLFIASLLPYLTWWWSIGLPTSMGSNANQLNLHINLIEIV
jgi:hypothetical protein